MSLRDHYDVVVIGGGIHGCGAAQAFAAAGYACLLIEKQDWAWATSSRSSKLLHGGLRYLQTAQLKLVRECLQEREILLANAPQLAHINWFYLPVYRHSKHKPWALFTGLSLYRVLTGWKNPHGRFKVIPQHAWHTLYGLETRDLCAVFAYQDGQTDDRLLTHAVKDSAISLGVDTACPAELLGAHFQGREWQIDLKLPEGMTTVRSAVLINTSGAWVNDVITRCGSTQCLPLELIQGTHLILEQQLSHACFYLEANDGRAVFVLPWHTHTLVGTTETAYIGNPAETTPLPHEVEYLLKTLRDHFPHADTRIRTQFSGLRVLPASSEKAFSRSRDIRLTDDRGLISLYGGKLTAYRATADHLLERARPYLPERSRIADTRTLPLKRPD
jgi:glycerol-3-phosphate dehydrogenase